MTVSNEAVEAGADYLRKTRWMIGHDEAATVSRRILEAGAPAIAAQALEEVANEFEASRFTDPWDIPDILRARAAALRGQG